MISATETEVRHMTPTKNMQAQLEKVQDGVWRWKSVGMPHGWTVQRMKVRGTPTYYDVRNERLGLTFESPDLKTVRERLPAVEAAYMVDETLLDGVEKTEEKLEQEARERPRAKKLAVADQVIRDILTARVREAQETYDKLMENLAKEGPARFPYEVRWGGDAVRGGYIIQDCKRLLVEKRADGKRYTAEERLIAIKNRHYRLCNDLLSGSMYHADSTSNFHRAVAREERAAAVEFFHLLERFLRIYREEYVDDIPEPITSGY
jgi:hypothetical protein